VSELKVDLGVKDRFSWGNPHGLSYSYFTVEDSRYYYSEDHKFTTPWDFKKDYPPTHIFIHIGANDNYHQVTNDDFIQTYITFIARLRELYPSQPIFVSHSWGRAYENKPVEPYYEGVYNDVVEKRKALGDENIHLIDARGWCSWSDLYPDNRHPHPKGYGNIADKLVEWLKQWGLEPDSDSATNPQ